jgi:LacI family transcriptional regulator
MIVPAGGPFRPVDPFPQIVACHCDNVVIGQYERGPSLSIPDLAVSGSSVYHAHVADLTTLSSGAPDELSRPTMRDVAALARVALKTVSRVINDEPGVSPELRGRVLRAIEQIGYRPNLTASSLRRMDGKTATLGTVLENVANPFSSALQRAVEDVAREHGLMVFASSADEDGERERALVLSFVSRRVDGLIIVPTAADHGYLAAERRAGLVVVFVDRPPRFLDADAVVSANSDGGAAAVRHLASHGHTRIAFVGDLPVIYTAAERLAGYRAGMRDGGLAVDETLIRVGVRSVEAATDAVTELLTSADPPTALFTAQNLITEGAVHALRRLGCQDRVALVGFDDFPMADLLQPAVTVIAQDPTRLGEVAASILFRRLAGDRSPSETVTVPVTLIARGSGEIRPPA